MAIRDPGDILTQFSNEPERQAQRATPPALWGENKEGWFNETTENYILVQRRVLGLCFAKEGDVRVGLLPKFQETFVLFLRGFFLSGLV